MHIKCEGTLIEDDSFTEKSQIIAMASVYDRCDVITDLEYEKNKDSE